MTQATQPTAPPPHGGTTTDETGNTRALVLSALVFVQVSFGINYIVSKVAMRQLDPQALATIRIVGGALALLAIARGTGRRWPTDWRAYRDLAVFSIFGVVLNQVLFIEGLHRTTPTHASLIVATIPVLTLLIAVLMGRERMSRVKALALLLAFSGVVLIVRPGPDLLQSSTAFGDLLMFGNCTSFAFFLVISKRLLAREDSLAATAILIAFGAVGIGILGFDEIRATDFAAITPLTWALVVYVIAFPTALSYWLQNWALARSESSFVAFFIYLQPVIATTLSVIFLGERPDLLVFAGGILIFLGVAVTLRR